MGQKLVDAAISPLDRHIMKLFPEHFDSDSGRQTLSSSTSFHPDDVWMHDDVQDEIHNYILFQTDDEYLRNLTINSFEFHANQYIISMIEKKPLTHVKKIGKFFEENWDFG
jgi:hypothetical protein